MSVIIEPSPEAIEEPEPPVGPPDSETDAEGGGERTSPARENIGVSTPRVHGRRLPPTTAKELRARATQITKVAARNFAPLLLKKARNHGLEANAFARPLRLTFEELGATFMKFGQLVGSSPGVFGDEVADEFRSCLDTGPPVPYDQVRTIIEEELGMPLDEAFAHFDPVPVGKASIAVVHRATTHDGHDVAVKILRPGIEQRIAVDLDLLQPLLELVARQTGDQAAGALLQMFDGFRLQLGEELDLRNEARAMDHYRELLELVDLPMITVPEPHHELSGMRVLTMEFLEGVPVDDLAAIEAYGFDPRPVVQQVVQGFLLTTIRWGNFHGDVHAGNLLMLPDGRIGVIDWGIVGRLDPTAHRFFRRLIQAGLGDESVWPDIADHIKEVYGPVIQEAFGLDDDRVVDFVRSMMEPVLTQPFGEVSLADLMNAPQEQARKARGIEAGDRSLRTIVRRFREQRRLRAMIDEHGGYQSDFDRGQFLLTKQLMYFERYGKMFMSDISLFDDREFFEALLAEHDD